MFGSIPSLPYLIVFSTFPFSQILLIIYALIILLFSSLLIPPIKFRIFSRFFMGSLIPYLSKNIFSYMCIHFLIVSTASCRH